MQVLHENQVFVVSGATIATTSRTVAALVSGPDESDSCGYYDD